VIMGDQATFKPEASPTVIPRIFHPDVGGLVSFVRDVFAARGEFHPERPAEMHIGESVVMISDGGGLRATFPACLYVYVAEVDRTCARAIERGARCIEVPSSTPWGDRRGIVEDLWGNIWQIASRGA